MTTDHSADNASFDDERFIDVVDVASVNCEMDGCSAPVAAIYAAVLPIEPERVGYVAVWACAEHGDRLEVFGRRQMADGAVHTGWTQRIDPGCLYGTDVVPCGDTTTHVLVTARRYGGAQRLETLSLCSRHAALAKEHVGAGST